MVGAAALLGFWLAWKRVNAATRQADAALKQSEISIKQADLDRRAHVAELFNRSIEQLADDKMQVRLAAVYTLRQIMRDFDDLADTTFSLLTAYVRTHNHNHKQGEEGETPNAVLDEILETLKERMSKS